MSSSEFHLVITNRISLFPVALSTRVCTYPVCFAHVTTCFTFWTMSLKGPHDSTAFPTVRCIRWAMHQYLQYCTCRSFLHIACSISGQILRTFIMSHTLTKVHAITRFKQLLYTQTEGLLHWFLGEKNRNIYDN